MRKIILDTETTGLDPRQGHRIIEIAAVEMVNRRLTKNHFHQYVNPQREIDSGAQQVHGISLEFLQDKPLFRDIVKDFMEFVSGAELVIHNAPFDIGFINSELKLLGMEMIEAQCPVVTDTLKMAKDLHPGQKNNLDALCRRYQIDNTNRTLHGALVDTELLAEVYLAMTRGQDSLIIEETIEGGIGEAMLRAMCRTIWSCSLPRRMNWKLTMLILARSTRPARAPVCGWRWSVPPARHDATGLAGNGAVTGFVASLFRPALPAGFAGGEAPGRSRLSWLDAALPAEFQSTGGAVVVADTLADV